MDKKNKIASKILVVLGAATIMASIYTCREVSAQSPQPNSNQTLQQRNFSDSDRGSLLRQRNLPTDVFQVTPSLSPSTASTPRLNTSKPSTERVNHPREWNNAFNGPTRPQSAGNLREDCATAVESFVEWADLSSIRHQHLYKTDRTFRVAADNVDKSCFRPLRQSDDEIIAGLATLSFNGAPFCTAFRLAPKSWMTAKHCFFDKGNESAPLDTYKNPSLVRFTLNAGIDNPIDLPIKNVSSSGGLDRSQSGPISNIDDVLVLEVDEGTKQFPKLLSFAPPSRGVPLRLYGVMRYVFEEGKTYPLRVSEGDSCYIGFVDKNGCIFHGCNATPAFSGSPLIAEIDGLPRIVGMHITGADLKTGCASDGPATTVGNIAVSTAKMLPVR